MHNSAAGSDDVLFSVILKKNIIAIIRGTFFLEILLDGYDAKSSRS